MLLSTLGERIHILRRRHGMTQHELATAARMSKNTIARLEQGDLQDLSGQFLVRLAKVFGVSIDYLMGVEEERAPQPVMHGARTYSEESCGL